MRNDVFVKRRLRQLVREELERTDVKAIVREVVREFLRARLDERDWHDQQRRPELKVVRK
jgi:methionine salvage enolase-phosphatase E1